VLNSAVHVAYSLTLESALLYDSCCTYPANALHLQQQLIDEAAPAYFKSQKSDVFARNIVPLSSSPFILTTPVPISLLIGPDTILTSRRIWKTWLNQSRLLPVCPFGI
jgi:hypothetical protein